MPRVFAPLATGLALALAAFPALAGPNLITNGSFEITTGTLQSGSVSAPGQITNSNLTGWTVGTTGTDLDVLYTPGSADTTGASGGSNGNIKLYGPGGGTLAPNYSLNGLPAVSPDGGNFVALDGDQTYGTSLMQSVGGLAIGTNYQLTFQWAGAREYGGAGGTSTESFNVSFGSQSATTGPVSTVAAGFSPWRQASFVFSATAASQLLTFLAVGGPNGTPPFSLLDGVSLVAVPEPAAWLMSVIGLVTLGLTMRLRRQFDARAGTHGPASHPGIAHG